MQARNLVFVVQFTVLLLIFSNGASPLAPLAHHSQQRGPEDDYDHTRGCEQLTCKADEHCMQRRFPCGDAKCPFMFYCFRSKRESLIGLESCASVLCSPGYKCLVDVRDCHWDQQCQQKRAMCVSEREFHEVPASCEEVTCPMNYRCILREAHCQRSPCKLVKSCAPNKEVHKWFHECRHLGCRSEHDCFLRKSKECMMPPCDYVPDCLNQINPNVTNDPCRGWVCPPGQICTTQTDSPCSHPSECRISRVCHHGTSLVGANSAWDFTEPLDVAVRKTTLADLEQEILLEEQRRMAAGFGPSMQANQSSQSEQTSTPSSVNPTLIARTHPGPAEYVPIDSKRASSVQNMRRASFDDSGWLAYLRRNVGSEAVEYWMGKARANENYQGFVKWLRSVEALLDPSTYQRWICEIASFPEFRTWLLPLNLQLNCFPTNLHGPQQSDERESLRAMYDDVSGDDHRNFPGSMTESSRLFFNPREKVKPSWTSPYQTGPHQPEVLLRTSAERAFMNPYNFTSIGNPHAPRTPSVDLQNYQRYYPANENDDQRNIQPNWMVQNKNEQTPSKRYEPIIYINRGRYGGSSEELKYKSKNVDQTAQGLINDQTLRANTKIEKQGTMSGFPGTRDLGPRQASQLKPNFVKFVTNQTSVPKIPAEIDNSDHQPNLLIYFPPPLSLVMYYSVKDNTDSIENASIAEESQIVPRVHDSEQSEMDKEWDDRNFTSVADADDSSGTLDRSRESNEKKEYGYIRKLIKELIQYWDEKETSLENKRGMTRDRAGSTASRPEKMNDSISFQGKSTSLKPVEDDRAKSLFDAFLKWFDQNSAKNATMMDNSSLKPSLSSLGANRGFSISYGDMKDKSIELSLDNTTSKKIQFFVGIDKNPEVIDDLISKYKGRNENRPSHHKDQIILNLKDFVDPREEELIFHKLINIAANNSNENFKKDEKMPRMLWVFPIYENDDDRLLSKLERMSHEKVSTRKHDDILGNQAQASSRIEKEVPAVEPSTTTTTTITTVKPSITSTVKPSPQTTPAKKKLSVQQNDTRSAFEKKLMENKELRGSLEIVGDDYEEEEDPKRRNRSKKKSKQAPKRY